MFTAFNKASTCVGCNTPTVSRTYQSRRSLGGGGSISITIGTEDASRLVVATMSCQGNTVTYNPTLNGQSPLLFVQGNSSGFAVWKVPTGTSATLVTNSSTTGFGGISAHSITGWTSITNIQFANYYGGDSLDWSFTAQPIPANTVIFGIWSTNEDGGSSVKKFNFGDANRWWSDGGEEDTGGSYEVITTADPAKVISCDSGGKRRSYGYLALSCENVYK